MPIPLIAAVLIAFGTASGGGGVALGGKGAYDIKQVQDQLKAARRRYEQRRLESEATLAVTNHNLAVLGEQQKQALCDVVLRMGDFLRRNERQVRNSERLLVEGIDATTSQVPGLRGLDIEAVRWISGALGSAAAGAGTGAGLTAAASSFGVASTGTTISGLSGAAAESATLALLGGGSIATGGGGVALGATVLNFVTVGPALLVGGFVVKGRGAKALTQAREFEAKIAIAIGELDETDARLAGVNARADELSHLLEALASKAVEALNDLESEPFDPEAHASQFQQAMSLVIAVRDVAATPLIDADGELSERSANLTIKYQRMTEEFADA